MSRGPSGSLRRGVGALVLGVALLVPSASVASGATQRVLAIERYELHGYEVWFAPTVGTFVGTGSPSESTISRLSAWHASIAHTEIMSPTGRITGGMATLYRVDGIWIHGTFTDGFARQIDAGNDCTSERHEVTGVLTGVTKSDAPGAVGVGFFDATLVHYRAFVFGRCYSYSASVTGSITIAV